MKRTLWLSVVGVALWLSLTSSSSATVVDVLWTGKTAFGGNDGLGLFGPAGTMPGDVPYTAEFRFDTTIGFAENLITGLESVAGGTFFDPDLPIPLINASVTINGNMVSANGDYFSELVRQTGQGASLLSTLAQRLIAGNPAPYGGELFQRAFRGGNFYSLPLDAPGEFDLDASDNPGGQILVFNRDANGNLSGPITQIQLIPSHVSIRPVPEPSCAMLLSTAGGALAVRRRRSALTEQCWLGKYWSA
jgi:hypothetical protein